MSMDAPFRVDFDADSVKRGNILPVITDEEMDRILEGPIWADLSLAKMYLASNEDSIEYIKKKNNWYQFGNYELALSTVMAAMRNTEDVVRIGIYTTYGLHNIPLKVVERDAEGYIGVRDGTADDTYRYMRKVVDRWNRSVYRRI